MGAQNLDGRKVAGKVRLSQGRVDFVVADLMQQNGFATLSASQFRNQVMLALLGIWRDWPVAQGADRVGHSDQLISGPEGTMPSGFRNSDGEK